MIAFLRGKKTYIMGGGMILYGLWVYLIEEDRARGVNLILAGWTTIFLRAGVSKATTRG